MEWLGYDYDEKIPDKKEAEITWQQKVCFHNWKATLLIISTVYDCTKCGVKKEELEKSQNHKK
jgi:hypothetical protein